MSIIVHMKHIGHTLLNDERYGGHEILKGTHFSKYKQFVNDCDSLSTSGTPCQDLGICTPRTGEGYVSAKLPEHAAHLMETYRNREEL